MTLDLNTSSLDLSTSSLDFCKIRYNTPVMKDLPCPFGPVNITSMCDCIAAANNQYSLVMIQLSLQKYAAHKQLSELFTQPVPKSKLPEDMENARLTLFSFYSQLSNLHEEAKEMKVIFIYISPEEQNIRGC